MFPTAPTSSVKMVKSTPPKAPGMPKSTVSKKAAAGKDLGKKNVPGKTGFNTVKNNALKEYGSSKIANKVAGSVFQNMRKSGKL